MEAILTEVAQGIFRLEGEKCGSGQLPAAYYVKGKQAAIVDIGPAAAVPRIMRALAQLGWHRDAVKYLIPTHIHVDHGGGAGLLARELPQAQVVAYRGAARHLLDPSRLVEGTRQAFGPAFEAEFGPILPVPPERLLAVDDGDGLDLGDRALDVYHTPGHANHHISIFDRQAGALCCGEALGQYLPGLELVRPAVTLPMFEVDAALETVARLSRLGASLLLFAQYGTSSDVERLLQLARESVHDYARIVLDGLREGLGEEEIAGRVADFERAAEDERGSPPVPDHWHSDYRRVAIGMSSYFKRKGLV